MANTDLCSKIKSYLLLRLDQRVSNGELARKFNVSLPHIMGNFHTCTNTSIQKWFEQQRMNKAFEFIREGKRLRDVAALLGYNYLSTFYSAFKRVHGVKPSKIDQYIRIKEISLSDIERYLLDRLGEIIQLEDVSKAFGLGQRTLSHAFRNRYGLSIIQWHLHQRMSKALTLLKEGCTVKQAAVELGYSTVTPFIIAFKKKYHTTPKRFKKIYPEASDLV